MASSHHRFYVPPATLSDRAAIKKEINYLYHVMASLQPTDPRYAENRAYFQGQLNNLSHRLAHVPPSASFAPGSATDWSTNPRKRSRVSSAHDIEQASPYGNNEPTSPITSLSLDDITGIWPDPQIHQPIVPQFGSDIIDLTEDDPLAQPFPQPSSYLQNSDLADVFSSDPFPELFHEYQPLSNQPQSNPASGGDAMDLDELAEFMMVPPRAAHHNHFAQLQHGTGIMSPSLRLEVPAIEPATQPAGWPLMGPTSPVPGEDRDVVDSIIESIKCQDDGLPRAQTPRQMSCQLMEHQKQALAWLLNMERGQNKGSILADEMGLGKTIEGLSLVIANPSKNPARKTTLIVAPVALMRQWEKEIERHVKPAYRLRVYVYHRAGTKADWNKLREYDIVLTTYGTLAQEQRRLDTHQESAAIDLERREPNRARTAKDRLGLLDPNCIWYRVILDEAQCIKNRRTQTSKAVASLTAVHRLCMTGTPMQNSVEDLYPLIRFLNITAYRAWPKFNDDIAKPVKSNHQWTRNRGMARLQALIKSVTLRREKTSIVDGRPVVDLPPKHINIRPVEFSHEEHELYQAVETKSQIRFNGYLKRGTVTNNYANILVMLLRLRQICCHPHLIKDLGIQVSTDGIAEEELKSRAQSLSIDVVRRLKGAESFDCPICYETELNPTIIIPCGHYCCGECFQKLIDPTRAIQDGNEDSTSKCPSCRGTLSSSRITDFRHFCKAWCPDKYEELRQTLTRDNADGAENEEDTDQSDEETSSDDEDDEDANDHTLGGFIVDDDVNDDDEMGDGYAPSAPGPSRSKKSVKIQVKKTKKKKERFSLAELKKLSTRSEHMRRKYEKRLEKGFKSSAKIDETMRLLANIRENDPTEKTLVFSSFTTLLDLLEVPLKRMKYKFHRYDGSMTFDDRIEAVNQFMDNADDNIMLISIKAGNAGLNLNKASQVVILDPFWNPFVEDQAVDRAHRMPQKRDVHVHRVLVPETVEDRICKLQDKKRDIINAALDERVGKSLVKLTVGELRSLFGM